MIASKTRRSQETGIYSSKDLADLLQMAHKMRMDEIKAQTDLEKAQAGNIKNQLMYKLMKVFLLDRATMEN